MRRAAAATIAMLFLASCGWTHHTKRYEPPGISAAAQPSSGMQLFARNCAWCHGDGGQGTSRAPAIVGTQKGPALADFMMRTGRMPIEDASDLVKRSRPTFSPETIGKIVGYLDSISSGGEPVPSPNPASGDTAEGEMLFQANCAACHSSTGIGGTLAGGQSHQTGSSRIGYQIPSLLDSSPVEIAEAMRTGPGTMPVFDVKSFSDAQVDSIIAFVGVLQRSQRRGGANLGRIGPVAEGAVAWIVGLGLLLLLARWIGSTTHEEDEKMMPK